MWVLFLLVVAVSVLGLMVIASSRGSQDPVARPANGWYDTPNAKEAYAMPSTILVATCTTCGKLNKMEFAAHNMKNLEIEIPRVKARCPMCRAIGYFSFRRATTSKTPSTDALIRDELEGAPLERRRHNAVDSPLKKDVTAVEKALKEVPDDG
jgi:hypothetical protein